MKMLSSALLVAVVSFSATAQECPKPRQGIRISATGDVLLHEALFKYVVDHRGRFDMLWSKLNPVLKNADLTVGNLEGPVAPGVIRGGKAVDDVGFVYDKRVYQGTDFVFNFHPYLIEDLQASGFDLLTTANNHSMDRGSLGMDRTIEQLNRINLPFVGSRSSQSNESRGKIINVRNYRIGVISCTEHLNGMPDPKGQVLKCNNDGIVDLIGSLKRSADAVLVFPHWGNEYELSPKRSQRNMAKKWIEAGAIAVIGNHPHVLQTTEWFNNKNGGKGLVVYSLGNFIAAQAAFERRVSAIAHIDLQSTRDGLEIAQFSYTPFVRPKGSISLSPVKADSQEGKFVKSQLGPALCQ